MDNDPKDDLLDDLFQTARAEAEAPLPVALRREILANAAAVTPQAAPMGKPRVAPRGRWWQTILSEMGGWPTVAGLATAMVAGVWIGGVQPDVTSPFLSLQSDETLTLDSFFPDYDSLFEEI